MKKWKVIAPLALSAAGALAAAAAILLKKPEAEEAAAPAPAKAKAKPAAPKAAVKNLLTGSYSFISGYKDAATVEVTLDYDADKYSFAVVEEDFLSYSSDSHVAVMYGEDFNLQLEYAGFYGGEDFAAHSAAVSAKYQGFAPVSYGAVQGVKYIDGDNVCLNLAIPGDAYSYLLVTLIKNPDYDEDFTTLPDHPDVAAILSSLQFARK